LRALALLARLTVSLRHVRIASLVKTADPAMNYRREIDGLRAVAVVPVILFHAGFSTFSGGFVGVDVFLVISGYLITTIILNNLRAGTFTLVDFYERRARRILPALFLVMLLCMPWAWLWLLPMDMRNFARSAGAVALFVSNVFFWQSSGYFDTAAELKPLLHTWSLSVEEQFYLLFPVLVMLLWRWGQRRLMLVFSVLGLCSLVFAHWGATRQPSATFYLLHTRGWELVLGACLAVHHADDTRRELSDTARQMGSVLGLAMVTASVVLFTKATPFPSLYALLPTVGTALIIACVGPHQWVGRILGHPWLVGMGLISYSAYLWHQPLFALARHRNIVEPSKSLMAVLAVFAVLLAYLSWKYVETPFRNHQRFGRKAVFTLSAAGSAFFLAFGFAGSQTDGFPDRMPQTLNVAGVTLPKIDNGWCFYSIDSISYLTHGAKALDCWLGDTTSAFHGVLFGDSFAGQYEPFWDALGKDARWRMHSITTNWCHPSNNEDFVGTPSSRAKAQCMFNRQYLLNHLHRYSLVVLAADWGNVHNQGRIEGAVALAKLAAVHAKLVVLMPSPKQFDVDVMALHRKSLLYGQNFDISKVHHQDDAATVLANAQLQALAQQHSNMVFITRDRLFAVDGQPSDVMKDKVPFSLDGRHISLRGAQEAAAQFLQSETYANIKQRLR
jgi:peptidoglycan/LPS O-acetylase OafA/YrhL